MKHPNIVLTEPPTYMDYCTNDNTLNIHPSCIKLSDDELIYLLLHELDHWAQDIGLTPEEREWVQRKYLEKEVNKHLEDDPFLERINAYPFGGWEDCKVDKKRFALIKNIGRKKRGDGT